MSPAQISGLVDDHGNPARWKVATLISVAALVVMLALNIAKAGAKAQLLESTAKKVEKLEDVPAKVERLQANTEEVFRRLGAIEAKVDELLKRRAR